MLESLGDTPASADRRWWTLSRQTGEAPGAFYLRVRSTGIRRIQGLETREEVCERMILSRFLSLLPQDCYNCQCSSQETSKWPGSCQICPRVRRRQDFFWKTKVEI